MGLFSSKLPVDDSLPRDDRGSGSFDDYRYVLVPNKARVTIRLANSNPYQHDLKAIVDSGATELETAISKRTQEEERVDAPIVVRLFTGARVSGPVGTVPRGLESVVDEALSRLDMTGRKQRIPVKITSKGGVYRVELLMGLTK